MLMDSKSQWSNYPCACASDHYLAQSCTAVRNSGNTIELIVTVSQSVSQVQIRSKGAEHTADQANRLISFPVSRPEMLLLSTADDPARQVSPKS